MENADVVKVKVKDDSTPFNCPKCNEELGFLWPPMHPLWTTPCKVRCKTCSTDFQVYQEVEE